MIYINVQKLNIFLNIVNQDLKMRANCSPPLKILYYQFSDSENVFEILMKTNSSLNSCDDPGIKFLLYMTDMLMSVQV